MRGVTRRLADGRDASLGGGHGKQAEKHDGVEQADKNNVVTAMNAVRKFVCPAGMPAPLNL
jgi:hypothetical protein